MRSTSILTSSFVIIVGIASPVLYFMGIFNILYLVPLFAAIIVFLHSPPAALILRINQFKYCKGFKRIKIGIRIKLVAFVVESLLLASLI
ncbi:MAG: hypothetical protein ACPK7O_03415 [Methanobacterium sp.]